MKEPCDRLVEVRAVLYSTKRAAVDRFGFHYQNYRDHEAGRIKISPEQAKVYARAFKTTTEYILYGKRQQSTKDGVGLIGWVQAGALAESPDNYVPGDADAYYPYEKGQHTKLIALDVVGTSMNRISPDGSKIIVDLLDREMSGNRLYIVRVGNETTYKRFKDNPRRLEPDSTDPAHETIFLDGLKAYPIGRVKRTLLDFD